MTISLWQAFAPIVNFIKNHQLSETLVKNDQFKEIQDYLGEVLQLAVKLEELNMQLDFEGKLDISKWTKYDTELESIVKRLNIEFKDNPYFAMSSINYRSYSQRITESLSNQDYETASGLRLEQIKLRDEILVTWVDYYLNIAGKIGILDQKFRIKTTDTLKRYLEGLKQHLQEN
jgi:hypothetical protein